MRSTPTSAQLDIVVAKARKKEKNVSKCNSFFFLFRVYIHSFSERHCVLNAQPLKRLTRSQSVGNKWKTHCDATIISASQRNEIIYFFFFLGSASQLILCCHYSNDGVKFFFLIWRLFRFVIGFRIDSTIARWNGISLLIIIGGGGGESRLNILSDLWCSIELIAAT